MLHLWHASTLEPLARRLAKRLEPAAGRESDAIFDDRRVIVPNLAMESYLKLTLARLQGVAANLTFQRLDDFISRLPGANATIKMAGRAEMAAALVGRFIEPSEEREPVPGPVERFLCAAGPAARPARAVQLAQRLAALFDDYQLARPELIAAWRRGEIGSHETERWQASLWRDLWAPDGLFNPASGQSVSRLMAITDILDALEPESIDCPQRVDLFGFSYLARAYHEILEKLGRLRDVGLYTVTPNSRADALTETELDLAPALGWSAPGREHLEIARSAGWTIEPLPERPAPDSLLGRLQSHLRAGSWDGASNETPVDPCGDRSVFLLAAPSGAREAELIADDIWRRLRQDVSAPSLRFNDVAVLIADRRHLDAYQSHLRTAFKQHGAIPMTLGAVSIREESTVLEAFHLLLEILDGDFSRPTIVRFLSNASVRARFPLARPDQWTQWLADLGVYDGADQSDLLGTYVERDLFHWDQGLARLGLGLFLEPQSMEDTKTLHRLPAAVPLTAAPSVGVLAGIMRSLVADARFARARSFTLDDWSRFLLDAAATYLAGATDEDERILATCRGRVAALRGADPTLRLWPWGAALPWAKGELDQVSTQRGHLLADGVAVMGLEEARPLPFRVIYVCGLGEGAFPAARRSDPLDLRDASRQPGDVSPRLRDQYMFLQTLLAARDAVVLSYVNRDDQTGDPLPASSVIEELSTTMERWLGRSGSQAWRTQGVAPLRRWDARHFDPASGWLSASPIAAREQAAATLGRLRRDVDRQDVAINGLRAAESPWREELGVLPAPPLINPSRPTQPLRVSLSQLLRFLENPLQAWASAVVGFRDEETIDDDESVEPFTADARERTPLLREVFLAAASAGELNSKSLSERLEGRLRDRERSSRWPTGPFFEAELASSAVTLDQWRNVWSAFPVDATAEIEIVGFGDRGREHATRRRPPLVLPVSLPSREGAFAATVEVTGRTDLFLPKWPGVVRLTASKDNQRRALLKPFLDAMILAASEEIRDPTFHASVVSASTKLEWRLDDVTADRARDYLTQLVTELLGSPHAYLLPFEAVELHMKSEDRRRDVVECVESLVNGGFKTFSGQEGPAPRVEDYPPPSEEVARAIIHRRFDWFWQGLSTADVE